VRQFIRRQAIVQRKQYRARGQHPVVGLEHAVAIRAQERDPVSRRDPSTAKRTREPADAAGKLRVGEAQVSTHHSRCAGVLLFRVPQEPQRGQWNIHDLLFLPGCLTAIHHQNVTGDVVGGIGGQKHDGPLQVMLAAETPQRNSFEKILLLMIQDPIHNGNRCARHPVVTMYR
jgi:hypothetical protein